MGRRASIYPTRGLRCVGCDGGRLKVVDSRPNATGIRRRRHCRACGMRMTTFEVVGPAGPSGEDTVQLMAALALYDKLNHMPNAERAAVLAMIKAVSDRYIAQPPSLPVLSGESMGVLGDDE
jgi:hypothetical protein